MTRAPIAFALILAACGTTTVPAPAPVPAKPAPSPESPKSIEPPAPAKPAPAAPGKSAPPPKVAAAPKAPPAPAAAAPKAPPAPAAAPLDLRSLEGRLKDTGAIGVLTKLSLKNQVDDLLARFRQYHAGTRPPTLAELKPAYELLLMKVLSLLQDKDAALARDINASREAIWGVLSDRGKFAQYS